MRRKAVQTDTVTKQELPVEFQALLLATAEDLASANIKLVDAQMEAAALKARVVALEAMRQRFEELEKLVHFMGIVTGDDLMKKSA